MKKLYITASVAFLSLFMMSFTFTNQQPSFNDLSKNSSELEAELGEFTEFMERRLTADKNEWSKRHKTWTELAFNQHMDAVGAVLNRN